jgi:hypothetical protein
MPLTEDFDIFYNTTDFAYAATYTAAGGTHPDDGTTVNVILDKKYIESNGVESYLPVARCEEADVSDASNGAQIRINSVDYYIRDVQPNGIGDVHLVLEVQ